MDDASIFRTMQRSGEIVATINMHAENKSVIEVLIEQTRENSRMIDARTMGARCSGGTL